MKIPGSVAIVTGASSGIGAATARALSAAGAKVILLARREERIKKLAEELSDAVAIRCDVTDRDQVDHAIQETLKIHGRIDILINNAGQALQAPIEQINIDDFRDIFELNVLAPLVMMQHALPAMHKQGAGSIVNVSSGIWFHPLAESAAYSATKAALSTISGVARIELEKANIAVSVIYPFITETELVASIKAGAESAKKLEAPIAAERQRPEQVAEKILELVRSGEKQADLVPVQYGGTYEG
ncbi:SDR family oxidoreductase [Acetobacter orleanensis]|uniref:Short-chain dehydrogenase n=1 Tax=Acetobacter orleanensis TaxID=104099 RepID=A0A4Y3TTG4_9PROT|nr:SDR family oxidoreductase [Acetobacter orleanensis]KXV66979.1 short-chain dehydrogenase [Acetobacter orleanensis]PCD78346.1 NAD(P)-dependent oxidoreductase [Acetobacter orleanensis]GAN67551.1 oxidoreductase/short-chain dehydrogenase/reductase SDR [Acetobacter orleanensis JCM 7639]GBR28948.1 dehydrogenase [Acetobacter orleanensis NRIC 0473]GEB84075.1 short-chain dehydrogenase [Acetobacter orleanensis]